VVRMIRRGMPPRCVALAESGTMLKARIALRPITTFHRHLAKILLLLLIPATISPLLPKPPICSLRRRTTSPRCRHCSSDRHRHRSPKASNYARAPSRRLHQLVRVSISPTHTRCDVHAIFLF
jgi:hypothetical protein